MTQVVSGIPTPRNAAARTAGARSAAARTAAARTAGGVPDDVVLETRRGRLVVRFTGEVDTALRSRFDRLLQTLRVAHEPVDVDCREVTFFCAEGVRMLLLLQRAAGGPGVADFQTSPSVERALHLTGIDRYPFAG